MSPQSLRQERIATTVAIVGAWTMFFAHALLTGDVPFDRDLLIGDIPARQFLQRELLRGSLPQWSPLEMFGTAFVGALTPATFHPQTLLLLFLSPTSAVKAIVLLSYLVAEAGTYRAARALGVSRAGGVAAAFAFAFGGYAIGMGNNLPYLVPLATMPWVFLAAWRTTERGRPRDAAFLAVTWALVLLGGDAQGFCECAALVVTPLLILGPTRRRALLLGGATVLACAIASIELLPAWEVSKDSFRREWRNVRLVSSRWALPPMRLPELAVAQYLPRKWEGYLGEHFLGGIRDNVWSSTVFAGGLSLWLGAAGLSRRTRMALVLGGVTVLAAWLSLGGYGGLLPLAWKVLPLTSRFRYPEKYLGLAWTTGSLLVGLGFDVARGRGAIAGGVIALVAALAVMFLPVVDWALGHQGITTSPTSPLVGDVQAAWTTGLVAAAGFLVLGGLTAWLLPSRRAWLVPAMVFLELYVGNRPFYRDARRAVIDERTPWADAILAAAPPNGPPPRTIPSLSGGAQLLTEEDEVEFDHVGMVGADGSRWGLIAFGDERPSEPERSMYLFGGKTGVDPKIWAGELNLCFRIAEEGAPPLAEGETVVGAVKWARLDLMKMPCRDRAFIAGAIPVDGESSAHQRMQAGLPRDTAVWEGGPELPPATGTVRWLKAEPNVIELETTTTARAALIVSDAWAPGWTATVDGTPAPIRIADAAVRGVEVPAGTHRVRMQYRAPGLATGAALCLLGLLASAGMALMGRRGRTHHESPSIPM